MPLLFRFDLPYLTHRLSAFTQLEEGKLRGQAYRFLLAMTVFLHYNQFLSIYVLSYILQHLKPGKQEDRYA